MSGDILVSDRVEARYADALDAAAPGVARVVLVNDGPSADPAAVGIAYFSQDLYPERTGAFVRAALAARDLRWFHTCSAGVDNPFFRGMLDRGIRLTNSSGIHAVPIAHTVMLYLLALSRDLAGWRDAQARRVWDPRDIQDLEGRRLGVVGLGPIGLEVARLGMAFRMRVTGLRRTPRGDEPCETWPLDRLPDLLAAVDALVLALPLTDATRQLLDAAALRLMKPSAVLVNVGRGEVVDESALIAALQERRLAGAGLDVFEVEPLPQASPLWTLPNVIVTPHSSGAHPGLFERGTDLFLENLARYTRGDSLRNEVAG